MKVSAGDFSQKQRNPKILGLRASWRPGYEKGLGNHVKNLPLHNSHNDVFRVKNESIIMQREILVK